ncbi:hypothetical protein DFH11DRAFT_882891 [Phellopilus nigrolimitatus]|nr:hypothetical protein DFH11DRAFT_882891 [Phellopilus nigrolimitatus]
MTSPTFPSTCLTPDQPGYGQILGNQQGKRRGRRAALPLPMSATLLPPQPSDFDTPSGSAGQQTRHVGLPGSIPLPPLSTIAAGEQVNSQLLPPSQLAGPSGTRHSDHYNDGRYPGGSGHYSYTAVSAQSSGSINPQYVLSPMPPPAPPPAAVHRPGTANEQYNASPSSGPIRDSPGPIHASSARFSPYPPAAHSRHRTATSSALPRTTAIDLPPLTIPSARVLGGSGIDSSRLATDAASRLANAETTTALAWRLNNDICIPLNEPRRVYNAPSNTPARLLVRLTSLVAKALGKHLFPGQRRRLLAPADL